MIRLNPFSFKLLGHVEGQPGPLDDFWYRPVGSRTGSGVAVDQQTALNYSAVWAATRILSETVASLPAVLFRKVGDREKKQAESHSLFEVLHDAANPAQDSMCFFEQMTAWLVNRGNAYAEIERAEFTDRVIALWPVHPSRIAQKEAVIDPDGTVTYTIRNDDGTTTPITNRAGELANLFHVTGPLSEDGVFGRGVIQQARESIGFGLATERHGASFFGNGARPGGVLKHPGALSPEARTNLRREWNEVHQGPAQSSKIALLQDGVDYEAIGVSNEDSQFLQTREFNVTEIARWYNLPPHRLGDLSRATFSNIEQQSIDFVIHSLRPWLVRWEKAIRRQLLTPNERRRLFFKFKIEGLLRGDSTARSAFYQSLFNMGVVSQNDIRELEDMNPIEDGDHYFVPMNIEPIEQRIEPEPEPVAPVVPEPSEEEEDENSLSAIVDCHRAQVRTYEGALVDQKLRHEEELEQVAEQLAEEVGRSTELAVNLLDAERRHERECDELRHENECNELRHEKTLSEQKANYEVCLEQAAGELTGERKRGAQLAGKLRDAEERHERERDALSEHYGRQCNEVRQAAYRVLNDAVQRMLTKESNAAKRATNKPGVFLNWLDSFYEAHTDTLSEAVTSSIEVIQATGGQIRVESFVSAHIDRSKEDLLRASECSPADLPESVAKCVAGWESRSKVD